MPPWGRGQALQWPTRPPVAGHISPLSLPSPSPCSSQWPRCSSFNTDSEHTSLPSLLPGKLCPSCLLGSLPCCLQNPPCCSPCQRRPPYLSMKHSTSSLSLSSFMMLCSSLHVTPSDIWHTCVYVNFFCLSPLKCKYHDHRDFVYFA